jgi:hypothetical protein
MAIALSDKLVQNILDSGIDPVFNSGTLEIRTGAPPGPGAAPTGTLLWSFALPADWIAAASGRSKAKNGTWTGAAVAGGVAGHYRMKAAGDTGAAVQTEARMEGTVTATGGGGDMTIDNTNIANGQTVTVNTFTVSM